MPSRILEMDEEERGGLTMQVHTDCFAYHEEGHCKALRQMDCYQCPFYKTKKELEEQLQKLGRLQEGELT